MVTPQMFVKLVSSGAQLQAQIVGSDDSSAWSLGDDGDVVFFLRSTALGANTALSGVLVGTPVTPAITANSAIISNITTDGDMLFAVSDNGHSKGLLKLDGATGRIGIGGIGDAVDTILHIESADPNLKIQDSSGSGDDAVAFVSFYDNVPVEMGFIGMGSTANSDIYLHANTGDLRLKAEDSSTVLIEGVTPTLTIGDAGAEDTKIIFDGNAADYHIGLDDTADDLVIGVGTALGTTTAMSIGSSTAIGLHRTDNANHGVLTGNFTSTGSDVRQHYFRFNSVFTAADGATTDVVNVALTGSIITQANSETIVDVAQLLVAEPGITKGSDTITNASTVKIISAPTEGNNNYALYVGAGASRFNGAISLGTDHGDDGQQLTSGGDDAACDWTAASSLREYKNIGEQASPQDALETMLSTPAYHFHYKDKKGTGDSSTEYIGVMADEAPWAMHYKGSIVNPVNTLGYTVLSVQALNAKIEKLEQELEALHS